MDSNYESKTPHFSLTLTGTFVSTTTAFPTYLLSSPLVLSIQETALKHGSTYGAVR
jgi:hypothetical protein